MSSSRQRRPRQSGHSEDRPETVAADARQTETITVTVRVDMPASSRRPSRLSTKLPFEGRVPVDGQIMRYRGPGPPWRLLKWSKTTSATFLEKMLDPGPRLTYRCALSALPRSSSGLGHQPLTLGTGVRNPYGAPFARAKCRIPDICDLFSALGRHRFDLQTDAIPSPLRLSGHGEARYDAALLEIEDCDAVPKRRYVMHRQAIARQR